MKKTAIFCEVSFHAKNTSFLAEPLELGSLIGIGELPAGHLMRSFQPITQHGLCEIKVLC